MNFKSQVSEIAEEFERRADELPERALEARKTITGWGTKLTSAARKNPGAFLVGAFAIGFVLAKVARHA